MTTKLDRPDLGSTNGQRPTTSRARVPGWDPQETLRAIIHELLDEILAERGLVDEALDRRLERQSPSV